MGPGTLVLAFALSLAPVVLATVEGSTLGGGELSVLALASLPWLALAGLPRAARGTPAVAVVGAALPALALAGAIDWRAGLEPERLGLTLAWGLALIALFAFAAERGRGALHGVLWIALVPGAAALTYALDAAADVAAPARLADVGELSPLIWALASAREGQAPFAALGAGLALVLVGGLRPSRSQASPEPA